MGSARSGPRGLLVVCAAVVALASSGCSSDEPAPELDLPSGPRPSATSPGEEGTGDGADSPSSSSEGGAPEVRPAPELGDQLEAAYGVWALQLPQEAPASEVGQALVDYMDVRTRALFEAEASLEDLARVSVGDPLTDVQGLVLDLRDDELHVAGDFWITVSDDDVRVRGAQGVLSDVCAQNATANVNAQEIAQEAPSDAYLVDATAARAAEGVWLVNSIEFEPVASC